MGTTFYQPQGDLDEMMHENFDALLYLADFCDSLVILSEGVVPPPALYPIDTVFSDFMLYWYAKNTDDNHPTQWELVELSNPSVIEDDLESGMGRWLLDGFTLSTTRAHSGTHSFFSGNIHDMNHAVRTSYPYLVQSGDSVTFWCWYDLEDDYDVAVVEVSENTKEWFNLDTTRFTGSQSSWTRKAYSLEDWVGKSVYIRFRSMTDTYTLDDGFYVDDIAPTCLYNAVDTISSIISDTFYAFTDHPEGDFYYYAKGYNTTWGWGDYSCLELVTVAYEVPPASPYIYNTKSGNAVVITWNKILTDTLGNPTTVDYYAVYRDTLPSFIVGPADSIGYVIHPDTTFTDAGALNDTASFYYLVLAVDEAGNKSKKSNMGYKFSKFLNENDNATDKNLVSLPWPCGYDTVSDLTDDLSAEGDPLVKITNLRDDQSYENWSFTTVPIPRWTGTNFAIIPGDAYEMVTIKDTNLVLVGSNDPDGLVSLNENPGNPDKDWVSIPYNTIYETVSDITDEYSPLGDPLAKLTNLRDDQLYESWSFTTVPFSRWIGTNFPNDRGRGYEFVTTHDTTWNPTEYSNEAFCGGRQVVNIIPHTSDAQVHAGTLTEPDRKPLWLTNDGNYVPANTTIKDDYREAGISHLVRGYFQLKGCKGIQFSVYRPERPHDVLTENMVGSGFAIDDDYALFWFDVGNFRKPWQEDDEVILIIGASQGDTRYFTDVNFDLDKNIDIQELGRLSFVPTAQGPQNGRATQVPVDYAFNIYPNPLVEQTRIDFALPQKAEVEMILYDVSGRQVKTLVSKLHKAGYYTISWNGLDDRGRTVPSGVYFVKFEASGYRVQEKILVVK